MAYTVPALQISQEFYQVPTFSNSPLSALIMGPFYPPSGFIKSIAVTTAGSGYTTPPAVTITDPTGAGSGATAAAVLSGTTVGSINLLTGGASYSSSSYATIAPIPGTATGIFTANSAGVLSVTMTNGGTGYTTIPTLTAAANVVSAGSGCTLGTPVTTGTTPNIAVTSIPITAGGSGYTVPPTIAFAGGTGTAATAVAVLTGGVVTAITITSAGAYTVAPTSATATTMATTGLTLTAVVSGGTITGITLGGTNTGWVNGVPTLTLPAPTGSTNAVAGALTLESTNGAAGTTTTRTEQWVPAGYTTANYVPFIGSVNQISDITNAFGDISCANTIAYGLLQAINNSNGATVYYCVTQPYTSYTEEQAYDNCLAAAAKGNYYGLVPLTFNPLVQNDVTAHVNSMSSPQNAKWRVAWYSTNSTGLALSALSPLTSFTGSGQEITTYLNAIQSSGSVPTASASVNAGTQRVHNVFPPIYTDASGITNQPGYFLAAALAGMRSGSAPHQSLTNTQVVGPASVPVVTQVYSVSALNQLAGAGVWIISQATTGGTCFTRHQLTGNSTNLAYREDSIMANVDSISYGLQNALAPFIGVYNITPAIILQIQSIIDSQLTYYLTNTYTTRAGNQLLGYKIVSIVQDPTYADMLDIVIQLQVPYPMNFINLMLTI